MHGSRKPFFRGGPNIFTGRSKAVLLLWIMLFLFQTGFCNAFKRVCLLMPCGHLLVRVDLLALVSDVY